RNTPYAQALFATEGNQNLTRDHVFFYWGKAEALYDDPEKINGKVAKTVLLRRGSAADQSIKSDLWLITPYFIPGKEGLEFLRTLREQGVHIQVLTNSLAATDIPMVFAGYKKYRKHLLKMGVELYELKPLVKPLHSRSRFLRSSGGRMGLHAK